MYLRWEARNARNARNTVGRLVSWVFRVFLYGRHYDDGKSRQVEVECEDEDEECKEKEMEEVRAYIGHE
jgi:hypothetical protein